MQTYTLANVELTDIGITAEVSFSRSTWTVREADVDGTWNSHKAAHNQDMSYKKKRSVILGGQSVDWSFMKYDVNTQWDGP